MFTQAQITDQYYSEVLGNVVEKYYKKDMANTGYVSIGHLTRLMSDENKIQVLRDFCKVLTQEISDSYINKDSLIYRFDLFFSNVKPTVESFTKVSRRLENRRKSYSN